MVEMFSEFANALLDMLQIVALAGAFASIVIGVSWIVKAKISG